MSLLQQICFIIYMQTFRITKNCKKKQINRLGKKFKNIEK
jgi:hypothetical protein